ncbi:hypothetical protein AC249_AIPGENE28436 [Exaiptasia diaphana]|nr:hypothetical protein AC249_AIPGENE28436 [Exaiptasia diaphana]
MLYTFPWSQTKRVSKTSIINEGHRHKINVGKYVVVDWGEEQNVVACIVDLNDEENVSKARARQVLADGIENLKKTEDRLQNSSASCSTPPPVGDGDIEAVFETPGANSPYALPDFSSFLQTPTMREIKKRLSDLENKIDQVLSAQKECANILQMLRVKVEEQQQQQPQQEPQQQQEQRQQQQKK